MWVCESSLPVMWGYEYSLPVMWSCEYSLPVMWGCQSSLPVMWGCESSLPVIPTRFALFYTNVGQPKNESTINPGQKHNISAVKPVDPITLEYPGIGPSSSRTPECSCWKLNRPCFFPFLHSMISWEETAVKISPKEKYFVSKLVPVKIPASLVVLDDFASIYLGTFVYPFCSYSVPLDKQSNIRSYNTS